MSPNGSQGGARAPIAARLRALHEVSLELSRTDDVSSLCRRAVELCIRTLGFDRIGIWFFDAEDPAWIVGTWGTDEEGRPRDERDKRIPKSSEDQREELYRGLIAYILVKDDRVFDDRGRPVGRSDKVIAPLWDGSRVIGELVADNLLSGLPMSDEDGEVIASLARTVAHLSALKRSEAALREALKEKAVLLDELKHRAMNSFTMMGSLISLEANRAGEGPTSEALRQLRDRVTVLASLYGQLDPSNGLESIGLDEYLRRIARDLWSGYGAESRGISLECDMESVRIDSKRAVPVGLIVNELVIDSLKHAFPDARSGKVTLYLRADAEAVTLAVSDDGVGLPPGFSAGSSSGFGMNLVAMLCSQLHAELETGGASKGPPARGASVSIRFAL